MEEREYDVGEIILKEGDPSEFVYQILSGEVEVFTKFHGETAVLGVMKAGEFLGEMGVVDGQLRSASARAKNRVSLKIFEKKEFFRLISQDSASAYRMITRLCERMRTLTRRLAEASSAMKITDAIEDDPLFSLPLNLPVAAESRGESVNYRITLLPSSPRLAPILPKEGITIMKWPFSVGRVPKKRESDPSTPVDLKIPDKRPFRLSRQHFALHRNPDGHGIMDLGSALGTEINGEFLGRHFGKDFGYLKRGENQVVAGGAGSPFVFKVLMEPI
jgi:CRP-like cAMP-binding protein